MIDFLLGFLSLYFLTYLLLAYLEEERPSSQPTAKPIVTVLIPAYNESKTIGKTIESALGLDYPSLEILVIDDGSKDDTGDIARKLGVRVLRQKNSGKAEALNNGISNAQGELIATLDADSFVAPDALLHMVGFFQDERVMAVIPTMKVLKGKGALVGLQYAEYMFSNLISKVLSSLDSNIVTPGPFSVFRASVFRELGGFDGRSMTEDNEMAMRIQSRNYLIRSSRDAVVYTKVPESLGALFRQRKRWYVGYMENLRRYSSLLRPKYGELGIFVLPVTTLLLVLMLLKYSHDSMSALAEALSGSTSAAGLHILQPYELLSAVSLAIGIILFYISILESRESPSVSAFLQLLLMGALSPFLYAYAFCMKGYEMITRRSAKW